MFITKKHLSRRTFLVGTFGATVTLPFLDAMVPALTAQSRTAAAGPLRFGAMYIPNGVYPDYLHPDTPGRDFEFKRIMQPAAGLRDYVTQVSKMTAPQGSVHLGASAAFLNGALAHSLVFDDTHAAGSLHPGAPNPFFGLDYFERAKVHEDIRCMRGGHWGENQLTGVWCVFLNCLRTFRLINGGFRPCLRYD